jgi:hypothetical protein
MTHEKGKLLKSRIKSRFKINAELDGVRVEDEYEAICKTCHQVDPKTKLAIVTYKYA